MGVESYSYGCARRIIPQMQNLFRIEILRRFVFDPIHCVAVKDQSGAAVGSPPDFGIFLLAAEIVEQLDFLSPYGLLVEVLTLECGSAGSKPSTFMISSSVPRILSGPGSRSS